MLAYVVLRYMPIIRLRICLYYACVYAYTTLAYMSHQHREDHEDTVLWLDCQLPETDGRKFSNFIDWL